MLIFFDKLRKNSKIMVSFSSSMAFSFCRRMTSVLVCLHACINAFIYAHQSSAHGQHAASTSHRGDWSVVRNVEVACADIALPVSEHPRLAAGRAAELLLTWRVGVEMLIIHHAHRCRSCYVYAITEQT